MIASVAHADIRSAIQSIHVWLRPEGVLVFVTATVPETRENMMIKWMGNEALVYGIESMMALDWIKQAGYHAVYQETTEFLPRAEEADICA